jgi:hypothetical protein
MLDGVGTLRLNGVLSWTATAQAGEDSWRFARGFWQPSVRATDADGLVVGEFDPGVIRRGGTLRWRGHEYTLRPNSGWRERYSLAEGDRELVVLDAKGSWGWVRRPVQLQVVQPGAVEPGLLLFAAYSVRSLANYASDTTASTAAATTTTSG